MEFWYYAADLNFLLAPWLLIITSETVRKEIKKTFMFLKKKENSNSVFVVSTRSNISTRLNK
jgi:hypothetical protein